MENILKNNKLIAEFLGTELLKELLSDNSGFINIEIDIYEQCKFHNDWNWLMEVVEKILDISLNLDSMEMYYNITDSIPNLTNVYEKCIEFIQWYNQSNQ